MTRFSTIVYVLVFLLMGAVGCTQQSPTLAHYDHDGIHFVHYSTWKVTKDAPIDGKLDIRSVQIQGPNHALVVMICEPAWSQQTLEDFAHKVASIRTLRIKEKLNFGPIKTADVTRGTEGIAHATIGGVKYTGIAQHFEIDMLGVPVPHDVAFYLIPTSRYHVMLMTQVATKYMEASRRGFKALLESMTFDEPSGPPPA